jgi:hypothetical protein
VLEDLDLDPDLLLDELDSTPTSSLSPSTPVSASPHSEEVEEVRTLHDDTSSEFEDEDGSKRKKARHKRSARSDGRKAGRGKHRDRRDKRQQAETSGSDVPAEPAELDYADVYRSVDSSEELFENPARRVPQSSEPPSRRQDMLGNRADRSAVGLSPRRGGGGEDTGGSLEDDLSELDGGDWEHSLDEPDAVSEEIPALSVRLLEEETGGAGEGDSFVSEEDLVNSGGIPSDPRDAVPALSSGDVSSRQVVLEIDVGAGRRAELVILPDSDPVVSDKGSLPFCIYLVLIRLCADACVTRSWLSSLCWLTSSPLSTLRRCWITFPRRNRYHLFSFAPSLLCRLLTFHDASYAQQETLAPTGRVSDSSAVADDMLESSLDDVAESASVTSDTAGDSSSVSEDGTAGGLSELDDSRTPGRDLLDELDLSRVDEDASPVLSPTVRSSALLSGSTEYQTSPRSREHERDAVPSSSDRFDQEHGGSPVEIGMGTVVSRLPVRTLWRSAAKSQWTSPASPGTDYGLVDEDAAHSSTDLQVLDTQDLDADEMVS